MRRADGRAALWLLLALALAAIAWWYLAPGSLPPVLRHAAPPSPGLTDTPPPLYKWRDAKGQLHVTDVPPGDRPYETVRYRPDLNVVPAYRRPGDAASETSPPKP